MKHRDRGLIFGVRGVGAAVCACSVMSVASAQSVDQAVEQNSGLLEEIVVQGYRVDASTSATGIVTSILDTPISITTLTAEFLDDTGSKQIMDAIGSLTGVMGQSNSGEVGANFGVRGFAVTPQVDGFDTLSTASGLGSSVGVERIEVVKGPSAVFNGNVPPGGTINIIYKKPSFKAKNYVEVGLGSWDYKSAEVFSTGPLFSDKLAYLINGYLKDADGWVNWTGQKEKTIIVGLTYKPIDDLTLSLNYRKADVETRASTLPVSHEGFMGSGTPWFVPLDAWVGANYGPLEPIQTITVEDYLPGGKRYNVLGPQNLNEADVEMASFDVNYRINDHIEVRNGFFYNTYLWQPLALIQSGAKVLGADGRSSILSMFLGGKTGETGWQNKLEAALDFDTGPISHQMLIGYSDSYSEADILEAYIGAPAIKPNGEPWDYRTDGPRMLRDEFNARLAANPTPDILSTDYGHTRTHAYYVAEQMSMLNDRLRALIGGRYTETTISGLRVTDTTPQAGLVIKPFSSDSPFADTSIFMNYSESFTPSGLLQPGTGQIVPPAQGTGKEIGIKTAWFDGEVASTISVFRDDLDNIATPDYSTQGQTGSIVSYHLGGKGRTEGGEAEIVWTPSSSLQLSANYTYMPTAEYLAYPGVPQQVGLRFGSTPKEQWNLTGRYAFADGFLSGAYVGGWIHGQSSTKGVLGGDWQYSIRIPSLVQADLFAGYTFFDKLEARVNVKNVGNRGGYVMNNAFQPNSPRSVYLTLNYSL